MADEKLELDLDPKKMLDALEELSEGVKHLSEDCEQALGKEAAKSIEKFTDAAEKGSTKVTTFFRNLGTRVKEDLKTAFDVGGLMAGLKMGKEIGSGIKQVFDMERAFDRLNTRLKMTTKQLADFKTSVGRRVSATGQKLEDVMPGVETTASKGGVKNAGELSDIGEALGRVKATTGEDTGDVADTVVEILKAQGQKVTADSFKRTLDAIQATRVSGAFQSAGEAGNAIKAMTQSLSPKQMKEMGIGTREMGGLAAMASKGGEHGQDILRHVLETAAKPGGKAQLNAIFGADIFKNGKLDVGAFQNINKGKFGQYSEQVLGEATGTNQADLSRFIDSMKGNMADFSQVTKGANETADQFSMATDNLASKVDKFKEGLVESGREIGEGFASMGKDLMEGKLKKFVGDLKSTAANAWDNKGTIAGGIGLTVGAGLLAGGAMNRLLGKIPGVGGMLKGAVGGELAKQMGAQPVYVVNASEIGGGGGPGGALAGLGGAAAKGAGALAAASIGYEVGDFLMKNTKLGSLSNKATDWLADQMHAQSSPAYDMYQQKEAFNQRNQTNLTLDEYAKAFETGALRAAATMNKKSQHTNPSAMPPRVGGH